MIYQIRREAMANDQFLVSRCIKIISIFTFHSQVLYCLLFDFLFSTLLDFLNVKLPYITKFIIGIIAIQSFHFSYPSTHCAWFQIKDITIYLVYLYISDSTIEKYPPTLKHRHTVHGDHYRHLILQTHAKLLAVATV